MRHDRNKLSADGCSFCPVMQRKPLLQHTTPLHQLLGGQSTHHFRSHLPAGVTNNVSADVSEAFVNRRIVGIRARPCRRRSAPAVNIHLHHLSVLLIVVVVHGSFHRPRT